MKKTPVYACRMPDGKRSVLVETPDGLACPDGRLFRFLPGTKAPVFALRPADTNEYSHADAAILHDNALRWLFATFRTQEAELRQALVSRLGLNPGARVLITGAGAGNDLPYLRTAIHADGEIYAQDIAAEMLKAAIARYGEPGGSEAQIHFSVSDAADLPFADGVFDAAYHFGGINLFSDVGAGIAEMNRVVKTGGRVVIGDEGLAPWLVNTEFGQAMIANNSLYACQAPLHLLPQTARNVSLTWELGDCFYVIAFDVADGRALVDLDVPHVGVRGGSIRTRYFGRLEGVSPDLRDAAYAEAARKGQSRVDFLEDVLRAALSKDKPPA